MPSPKRHNRHQRPKRGGSWDRLADWYDSWVGQNGGRHHRSLAMPLVMQLLSPRHGERVLDVGCGQGVLAPHILRAGAAYTGVDNSPRLLRLARSRHPGVNFALGDARRLQAVPDLRRTRFDAVVALFSLQDIDPMEDVIRSAAGLLVPGGRLVFLITHPAFRIPRQSGWGWDEGRKLRYRRVDAYITRRAIPLAPVGARGAVMTSFHRPLGDYLNAIAEAGLRLDELQEVAPAVASESREIPLYLALRAVKDER